MQILIKNGTIVDGTGAPGVKTDLLVKDGKIDSIGAFEEIEADRVIDAEGKVVSPGFIDVHAHYDLLMAFEENRKYIYPLLLQGQTTVVNGNCGVSPAPTFGPHMKELKKYYGDIGAPQGWVPEAHCGSMKSYFDRVEKTNPMLNIAQFMGHMGIRTSVMGFRSGRPGEDEMKQMKQIVRKAMEEGAIGLSFGLEYVVDAWTDTQEMIELSKAVRPYGGRISAHIRTQGMHILSAVKEMVQVAEAAGVPLQISHLMPFNADAEAEFGQCLEAIEQARNRGVAVGIDLVTYVYAMTVLTLLYPGWVYEGGFDNARARLGDPECRNRLRDYYTNVRNVGFNTWETKCHPYNDWLVSGGSVENYARMLRPLGFKREKNKKYHRWTLFDIARDRGRDILDTLFDITLEEDFNLDMAVSFTPEADADAFVDNDEIARAAIPIYQLPYCTVGADVIAAHRGGNPGLYGTFPRYIGRIGRDWGAFSLEEAVRKCTGLSADQMGLKDRGYIREGYYADLVIFDPDRIIDRADFETPDAKPEGLDKVLVNGQVVVENNRIVDDTGHGTIIRNH